MTLDIETETPSNRPEKLIIDDILDSLQSVTYDLELIAHENGDADMRAKVEKAYDLMNRVKVTRQRPAWELEGDLYSYSLTIGD